MTGLPDIRTRCPACGVEDLHFIEHRPALAGTFALWPDPAAGHYARECRVCGHAWRTSAESSGNTELPPMG